ncbi:MAG: phosphatidate cytidylyltransferase [Tissierellaceae bacterium]|nr:phosphatidate cytidylyltransferase [Tissierellaceae bacterium]
MKNFAIRTISGIIGVIIVMFIVSKGGIMLDLSIFFVSLIGIYELNKAFGNIKDNKMVPNIWLGILFTCGLFISSINNNVLPFNLMINLMMLMLLIIIVLNKKISVYNVSITLFSVMYVPFFMFHIVYLDKSIYIWLVFIIAWGTDTFAYIFGNLMGKRKLCPELSPHKTLEGSIGGVLASIFLVLAFSIYFNIAPLWKMIILSVLGSVGAQFGDLAASRIKRTVNIKDYGYIIPGHGGVLDRFDSIIFVAPIVYYYVSYILK